MLLTSAVKKVDDDSIRTDEALCINTFFFFLVKMFIGFHA